MKISVALCTYNGAEFLERQLESFLEQKRLPDELIVNDDCSTDETIEIIERYRRKSPFLVDLEINEENCGSNRNFEKAISRCTGDLIFLSDQDDIWLTDKIYEIEKAFAKDSKVGLVFSNAALIDEKGESLNFNLWDFTLTPTERKLIRQGMEFEVIFRRNVVTGATAAFRSSLIEHILPFEKSIPDLYHDGWITLIASMHSRISFIKKNLILYRQHERQQIGVDWKPRKADGKLFSKFSRKYPDRADWFDVSIKFLQREIKKIEKTGEALRGRKNVKIPIRDLDRLEKECVAEKLKQIAHLELRRNLPKSRFKRIIPIARESLTGRYHLYSRGKQGIGRDLLEKWK